MDDTKRSSVPQNNEDVDRDYDAEQSGSNDRRGKQSQSGRTAADPARQASSDPGQMGGGRSRTTTSGRTMSGQRSQNDAEDGLGSSTTGRAGKSVDQPQDDDDEDEASSEEELR